MSVRAWGWAGPVAIAVFAFVLRIWNLGSPGRLLFDETYYAKDAWSLWQSGYARETVEDANKLIESGTLDGVFLPEPSWAVHPEGGKLLIGLGEQLFGMNAFGWRIASVVAGSLLVLVTARLVLRMTASVSLACVAGLLLAFDGAHFVLSRLALLDIFLALWLVCGAAALAADRDWLDVRLGFGDEYRWWRPWQLVAAVCFGLAAATKWSGLYVLAALAVACVCWEFWLRRSIAADALGLAGFAAIASRSFIRMIPLTFVVYLATWLPWLKHHAVFEAKFGHGYGEYEPWGAYLEQPTSGPLSEAWRALRSWWEYQSMTYAFHTGEQLSKATHPYESHPLGWLVQYRPVSVDTTLDIDPARCGAPADSECMREILILGNPVVWWIVAALLVVAVGWWTRSRSWQLSVPLLGVAATWLPWFFVGDRPIFSFYAIAILPFMVVAAMLVLKEVSAVWITEAQRAAVAKVPVVSVAAGPISVTHRVAGGWQGFDSGLGSGSGSGSGLGSGEVSQLAAPPEADPAQVEVVRRRTRARWACAAALGVWLVFVVAGFIYFLPLWNNSLIPYDAWLSRMWLSTWI